MKPTKTTKTGNLTKQREVACPTCHAPIGEFCKSVGARGKAAGAIMKTSCHNARITAAGLPLRDFHKTSTKLKSLSSAAAKARANRKRSEAMRLSWKRRKSLKELMNTPSILERQSGPAIRESLYELVADTIELLEAKPYLKGASAHGQGWNVTTSRTIPEGFNITIVKR